MIWLSRCYFYRARSSGLASMGFLLIEWNAEVRKDANDSLGLSGADNCLLLNLLDNIDMVLNLDDQIILKFCKSGGAALPFFVPLHRHFQW